MTKLGFAVAALAFGGMAATAQAAPMVGSGLKDIIASEAIVDKTHGVHRYCGRGPAGWHRHGRFGGRIACPPPRLYRKYRRY